MERSDGWWCFVFDFVPFTYFPQKKSESVWLKKNNLASRHEEVGLGERDPLPLVWEFSPHNPVFFSESVPKSNLKWERPMMNSLKSTSPFPSSSNISITLLGCQCLTRLESKYEETWRGGFAATLVNSWTPRSTVSRTRPGPFWVDQIFGFQRFYGFTSGADISFTNYWFDVCIEILKFLWNKYGNAHWKRCSF